MSSRPLVALELTVIDPLGSVEVTEVLEMEAIVKTVESSLTQHTESGLPLLSNIFLSLSEDSCSESEDESDYYNSRSESDDDDD